MIKVGIAGYGVIGQRLADGVAMQADMELVGVADLAPTLSIRALKERGPDARVGDAMTGPLPTLSHRSCLEEAFRVLQEKSVPAVGVVNAAGRLIGLVTSETVAEMLMVQRAMPSGARLGPWSRPAGA